MILDADKYRVNVDKIKDLLDNHKERDLNKYIGAMAVITGAPIITVAAYVGEIYGFNDSLLAFIKRLMGFYKINKVINIKGLGELTLDSTLSDTL